MTDRTRILFLGADLNPISVRCLQGLVVSNEFEIMVGLDGGQFKGPVSAVLTAWKRHGTGGVVRRLIAKRRAAKRMSQNANLPSDECLSIRQLTMAYRLPVLTHGPVNAQSSLREIEEFGPQLIVVANFSQILRPPLLSRAEFGAINFHPSMLPKYRGPAPFYWVLRNGGPTTGVTIHHVDRGVDTGDVILQREFEIDSDDTEATLREKAIELGVPLLVQAAQTVTEGTATRTPQNESEMCYFGFPPRGDSEL